MSGKAVIIPLRPQAHLEATGALPPLYALMSPVAGRIAILPATKLALSLRALPMAAMIPICRI